MKKQLTTVQQNKRNRIIKRIIYGIFLAIAIPSAYLYCSNFLEDYFYDLSDISISTTKSYNKKHITKIDNTNDDKETNDENIVLNNKKDTSIISEKKNIEETTNNSTTTIKDKDDNDANISDRFSSYEPTLPSEQKKEINNNKSEDTTSSSTNSNETNLNNEQISKYQIQTEELNGIKTKYDAKVSAIETWYNEEFNKNYELMMEAKNAYEDLGGYATEDDKNTALNKLKSADQELANSGLSNSGYAANYKKTLQEEYELVCKRYTYSQQYEKYYEYIYTTLPAKKTEKLSQATQEYNQDLQNYKDKYGL